MVEVQALSMAIGMLWECEEWLRKTHWEREECSRFMAWARCFLKIVFEAVSKRIGPIGFAFGRYHLTSTKTKLLYKGENILLVPSL